MSPQITKVYLKILSAYFLIGGIGFFISILSNMGLIGMFRSLLSVLITLVLLMFSIIIGVYGLTAKANDKHASHFIASGLISHSIQLSLMRFVFKNYFGPYFAIGFTNTPTFDLKIKVELFSWSFINGLNTGSDEISILINLVPVILLIILLNVVKSI